MSECAADGYPIISTTHGQVRGKLRETVYDDKYYCFDGIPYAEPPVGKLRFRSPQPIEPWSGVRDCTEIAPKCVQYNRHTDRVEGSEDCLYLNIYAKKLTSEKRLPVMVYIHGGALHTGSASRLDWGPDYFMMKDVILVTVGYRLGPFGFMEFPEQNLRVSGNAGLKDIFVALKWLKQNYHNFNGDSEKVTLFGHSSGSEVVHLLSIAPQCEGLFHKAILMSGLLVDTSRIPNITYRFAKHIGYDGPEDNEKILNYLLAVDAEKLCDLKFMTPEESEQGYGHFNFWPTIENPNVSDAIITKDILDMMSNADVWSRNIPIMLGACSFESLVRYDFFTKKPNFLDTLKEHPEYMLRKDIKSRCNLKTQLELINKIIKHHMGDKELTKENIMDILDIDSYAYIYHKIHRFSYVRLMQAKAPTYLYRFDYDSPDFNLYRIRILGRHLRGCCHVSDLAFLFYIPQSFQLARDSENFKMIELMMNLLTGFATNSDPNTESMKPVVWDPLSANGTPKCLNISNEHTFIDWPEYENCLKWDEFYREVGLRLF